MNLNQTLQEKYPHLELSVLKLSEVQKDNESKRIDSEYFKKEYLENEEIIEQGNWRLRIKDCVDLKIDNIKSFKLNKNFNYLQISDIDLVNGLEFSTTEIDFRNIPDRATYILHNNDICVSTVRPNRNAVALIKDKRRLIGTSGFTILRINNKNIIPEFLYIFCKTDFFITKMMRANTASLYPAVLDSDVLKCLIPILPMEFQLEIEKMVKDSHHALESSNALYKEAEVILYEELGLDPNNPLDSILHYDKPNHCDNFICHSERSEESIKDSKINNSPSPAEGARGWVESKSKTTNHQIDWVKFTTDSNNTESTIDSKDISHSLNMTDFHNALNISIRTLKESFLKTGRLDSEYYQIKYDLIEAKIKKFATIQLKDLVDYPISSGATPKAGGEDYTNSHNGIAFLRAVDLKNSRVDDKNLIYIKPQIHNKLLKRTKLQKNDVLFSIAGTIGRCAIFDYEFQANINQALCILRFKESKGILRLYLIMFFNSKFGQTYLEKYSRQGLQTNLNLEEVGNLEIPKIDSKIQEQIAQYIQKSFALRAEAKALLESAKIKVEEAIKLNGGGKPR